MGEFRVQATEINRRVFVEKSLGIAAAVTLSSSTVPAQAAQNDNAKRTRVFRGGTIDRATLDVRLGPLAYELERLLEAGHRCADAKAAGFCANLYELRLAAWQFVVTEGLELSFWATERAASARRRGRPLSSRIAWGR